MTLEISEQERDLLLELLKTEHKSLLDELLHTDGYEYRELLKQKFELLKVLQSRVEATLSDRLTV
ncbi:MAG TPA: hypothetical protein VGC97_14930 [Pyrinomonadaceae bacterium]|jgi:hypothetical protein